MRKLRTGAMPPLACRGRTRRRTTPSRRGWRTRWIARRRPGRIPAGPASDASTVRILERHARPLALDIDGRSMLPSDESSDGFDNIAEALSISPALMERYMVAARKIAVSRLGDPTIRPGVATSRFPRFSAGRAHERRPPIRLAGGMAIRHYFPLDGDYLVKIDLLERSGRHIRGLDEGNSWTSVWTASESSCSPSAVSTKASRPSAPWRWRGRKSVALLVNGG